MTERSLEAAPKPAGPAIPGPAPAIGAKPPSSDAPASAIRTAELLSIGTELTVGDTRDTNAGDLARDLTRRGVRIGRLTALPDRLETVRDAFSRAVERADLVVSTGGLGPTPDDLTREAIAAALGETPEVDPELEAWLHELLDAPRPGVSDDEPQAGMAHPVGRGNSQSQRHRARLVGRDDERRRHRRAARPAA